MRHLDQNFYALYKGIHPYVPLLLCTNFTRHIITNANFNALVACHPVLEIIFYRRMNQSMFGTSVCQCTSTHDKSMHAKCPSTLEVLVDRCTQVSEIDLQTYSYTRHSWYSHSFVKLPVSSTVGNLNYRNTTNSVGLGVGDEKICSIFMHHTILLLKT